MKKLQKRVKRKNKVKTIDSEYISGIIAQNYSHINIYQNKDIVRYFKKIRVSDPKKQIILKNINDNADIAAKRKIPLCQDTGIPIIFIELPENTYIKGNLEKATIKAMKKISIEKGLRFSIVKNPFSEKRQVIQNNPIIHIIRSERKKVRITIMAKGGGSENVSLLKMMNPSSTPIQIADEIINAIKKASSKACPPYIIGAGIGSSIENSALYSKMALSGKFNHNRIKEEKFISDIVMKKSKKLKIGIQGFGFGDTIIDCRVKILPSHIACLPLSIGFNCFQERVKSVIL